MNSDDPVFLAECRQVWIAAFTAYFGTPDLSDYTNEALKLARKLAREHAEMVINEYINRFGH